MRSGRTVNEVLVTQAELDRIAQIAQDVYGYEPGRTVSEAFDFDDEKYLTKLDWYMSNRLVIDLYVQRFV